MGSGWFFSERRSNGNHPPLAKKAKRGEKEEMQGMHLPDHVLETVVGFCDIPELGKLACVSKALNRMTSKDELWERPLQSLLNKAYDDKYYIEPKCQFYFWDDEERVIEGALPVPLSRRRPMKSTDLLAWSREWRGGHSFEHPEHGRLVPSHFLYHRSIVRGNFADPEGNSVKLSDARISTKLESIPEYCWLFEDVSLKEYYKGAGGWAYKTYREEMDRKEDEWKNALDEDSWSVSSLGEDPDPNMFYGLPNIRLFGGHAGRRTRSYYYDY